MSLTTFPPTDLLSSRSHSSLRNSGEFVKTALSVSLTQTLPELPACFCKQAAIPASLFATERARDPHRCRLGREDSPCGFPAAWGSQEHTQPRLPAPASPPVLLAQAFLQQRCELQEVTHRLGGTLATKTTPLLGPGEF